MTGRNPNVFYEVGYAHALGKLTVLLTENANDIPFDLKHFPHIVYGKKISVLRKELEKKIRYFSENPPTRVSDVKTGLELFVDDRALSTDPIEYILKDSRVFSPKFVVFNSSSDVYLSEDYKIGIVTKSFRNAGIRRVSEMVDLPDGKYLHIFKGHSTLFPEAYTSIVISLFTSDENPVKVGEREEILVKLFTKQGSREFRVSLIWEGE